MAGRGGGGSLADAKADAAAGEFEALLLDVAKEPVPQPIVDLARNLQAALIPQRCRLE